MLGKVKSRLAVTVGKQRALDIYNTLLTHTLNISKNLPAEKFIFYEDYINQDDLWDNEIYNKNLQQGTDLGQRMKNAFEDLFNKGYKKVLIIGSDCYELTETIINSAFDLLSVKDVVIGQASDGGYYLLGMKTFIPQLFKNKSWSSGSVYNDTVKQINELGYSFTSLIVLNDVDEESDIDFNKLNKIMNP